MTECTALCSAIDQLNWLAGMSRPEISFEICNVASTVNWLAGMSRPEISFEIWNVASTVKEAITCNAIQINSFTSRTADQQVLF